MAAVAVSPSSPRGRFGWSQSGPRGGRADGSTWQRPGAAAPASAGRLPEGMIGKYKEALCLILKREQLYSSGFDNLYNVLNFNTQIL